MMETKNKLQTDPTSIRIGVLGAGMIGLTSAIRLSECFSNAKIIVYADAFSPHTTSDVSAGYWEPYCIQSGSQTPKILEWGKETYDIMLKTAFSEHASQCGVQALSAYVLQDTEETQVPYWSTIVEQFKTLNINEIKGILQNEHPKIKSGFQFLTTTVILTKYLPYLMRRLEAKGVEFVKRKFVSSDEIVEEANNGKFNYFINCSGLMSRFLFNDTQVHPIRGHVLRIRAPWIKSVVMLDYETTYILPLSDLVVIGGTAEKDVYDLNPNPVEFEKIIERTSKLIPSIKYAEVVSKQAGLRPGRTTVRLEMEMFKNSLGQNTKIIHNYGHGGSGITLAWGCASNVLDLILEDLKIRSKL